MDGATRVRSLLPELFCCPPLTLVDNPLMDERAPWARKRSETEQRRNAQRLYELGVEFCEVGCEDPALVYDEEKDLFGFVDGRFACSREHADWALLRKRGCLRSRAACYGDGMPRSVPQRRPWPRRAVGPSRGCPCGRRYFSRKSSNLCATCNPSPPKPPVFVQSRIPRAAALDSSNALRWSVRGGSCELLMHEGPGSSLQKMAAWQMRLVRRMPNIHSGRQETR